jgi:hypothetical protein
MMICGDWIPTKARTLVQTLHLALSAFDAACPGFYHADRVLANFAGLEPSERFELRGSADR